MKILATLFALVIIVLLGACYFVFSEAGNVTKKVMERIIPEATNTAFAVESVDISFLTGGASVKGFVIGNPSGYKSDKAFAFDQVAVDVDVRSILTDLVVVDQVLISKPKIFFEKTISGSNIKDIQQAIEKYVAANTSGSTTEETPAGKEAGASKKVAVREFYFEEGIIAATIPTGDTFELTMPSFKLENLGTDGSGITGEVLLKKVLSEVTKVVLAQTQEIGASTVKEILNNPAEAQKIIEEKLKDGEKSLDKIKEGFGGLLNKK